MTPTEIKIALLYKGITMADIARTLNVSRTAVHYVVYRKSGTRRIKIAIAAALSMTVEDLWPPKAAPKTFTDLDYVLGASERLGLSMESDRAA